MQVTIKHLIDDVQCYQTVRELRWPDGVRCPSCAGIFLGWFISLLFPVIADIEQPLTRRNLINLAHILPKQSKDFDLHLVETFNEVMHLTLYAHPDPMNPFKQLENPT